MTTTIEFVPVPRSLSVTATVTLCAPAVENAWAGPVQALPATVPGSSPDPSPWFTVQVNGASPTPGSAKVAPATTLPSPGTGPGTTVGGFTVGATFWTLTVADATVDRPLASVTRTLTGTPSGPSTALYGTTWPRVSNVPSSSRSQAKVTAVPSGSLPVAPSITAWPSFTVYGPPADAVGGWSRFKPTSTGSWSESRN